MPGYMNLEEALFGDVARLMSLDDLTDGMALMEEALGKKKFGDALIPARPPSTIDLSSMAAGNTFEVDEGLNGAELELSVVHH